MTVSELQELLATLDPQQTAMIAVNGVFSHVSGVAGKAGGSVAVIRGKGKTQEGTRFSVQEEGLIGHLSELGLSNGQIGEVLGRSADSVKRKRKALGF